ncbi:hypothetical protein PKF023_16800 [Polynucleobacter yangtzensis]|uniref:Uncharacterized protein n=1 Tax=Polynucleobacter yangtzensis TaxID=1743159 RepID=A0A9C7CZ36_9BURK|nr:hypothetical protein [Polynucleobacter yangtzensis]BDT77877.1 hypothetical protein PKF023_16800 [Polynucleobacter yangtzensis]
MKIKEITNAQDQLNLLRVIIDNTWSAIKQQADVEGRQKTAKAKVPRSKAVKAPKRPPYAPAPKPLPQPVTQQPVAAQKQAPVNPVKQVSPGATSQRSPEEVKAFQDYLRGEKAKPL